MTRTTIDFGIDLGTTNSSVAVLDKHGPHVLRNNEGMQYTPSAVWMDKNGAIRVGASAKDRLVSDPENSSSEFKLWMGKAQKKNFSRSQRVFSPEELSAEVLKSLKQDVKRETGEEIESVVITVPAAFDQPESEATRRAAQLAGIKNSPLLQEPIAAALAYGFQTEQDNVFWLVFDMGGGTFDAAVIHVRDGLIQVVNHGGDNHLGGKLIDWAIVDQLFVPQIVREYRLTDFVRGEKFPKWWGAFAKLKQLAEKTKIALSKDETTDIQGEFIGVDDEGTPVQLECSITREQVESILQPYLGRAINICRRVLAEKKLGPKNIEKVLLVGGPTYTPYLRQVLADTREGLGIPLEFGVDPLTVVAQGAALFAGGQRLERPKMPVAAGNYSLELLYKPIGTETEPQVGGRIASVERTRFNGFMIRFTNAEARPPWNSGNLPIQDNGTFMTRLLAEKQRQNTYSIELFDPSGNKCEVSPSSMSYTIGLVITDPPLTHNIGVAMANNEVDVFFEKGTPLPAKSKPHIHRTVVAIRRGSNDGQITIPFVEGDHLNGDLNRKIGEFSIRASQISRDIPMGSDFEIKLEIDSSRLLKGSIYVPILDEEFQLKIDQLVRPNPNPGELKRDFDLQKQKLKEIEQLVAGANNSQLAQGLAELRREDAVGIIESGLHAADDHDAALTCENQLLDLKAAVRKLEVVAKVPKLVAEAKDEIEWTREVAEAHGDAEDKQLYQQLKAEIEAALDGDTEFLEKKTIRLYQLRIRMLARTPDYWLGYREYLQQRKGEMADQAQAQVWFSHADRAINGGDLEGLKSACRQLLALLPVAEQQRGYGGTTVRAHGGR
jgi:molecular chaperone DnaK